MKLIKEVAAEKGETLPLKQSEWSVASLAHAGMIISCPGFMLRMDLDQLNDLFDIAEDGDMGTITDHDGEEVDVEVLDDGILLTRDDDKTYPNGVLLDLDTLKKMGIERPEEEVQEGTLVERIEEGQYWSIMLHPEFEDAHKPAGGVALLIQHALEPLGEVTFKRAFKPKDGGGFEFFLACSDVTDEDRIWHALQHLPEGWGGMIEPKKKPRPKKVAEGEQPEATIDQELEEGVKRAYRRSGRKIKRGFRVTSGFRKGRVVSSVKSAYKPRAKASTRMKLKIASKRKKIIRVLKSKRTRKRSLSKRLASLNKRVG